ncbi:hypothetical protein FIU83_06500 [Halomonas sp. THAF5a]|uniref:DUF1654 domain-containing protein n=1 Tax=Halomonas sp. THAF5a TaxID=2587844 RepID=UPI0012AA0E2D|nr:DUF1654 domain-containing protein [Halomonas sp. THAF5a]QFU01286.1 hypothetical protein FIU83_06500 [Halomonas sp. THAF5a]
MPHPSSYDQLAQRIHIEIAAANRRQNRQVHLKPAAEDDLNAWNLIIEEIDENENVDVTRTYEGWLVSWIPTKV